MNTPYGTSQTAENIQEKPQIAQVEDFKGLEDHVLPTCSPSPNKVNLVISTSLLKECPLGMTTNRKYINCMYMHICMNICLRAYTYAEMHVCICYIYYYILPVVTPKCLFTCPVHTDFPFPTPWRPQKARGAQQHIHGAAQVALIRGGGLGSGTQNRQALPGFVASVHQVLPEFLVPQGCLSDLNDLNSSLVQWDLAAQSVWWLL